VAENNRPRTNTEEHGKKQEKYLLIVRVIPCPSGAENNWPRTNAEEYGKKQEQYLLIVRVIPCHSVAESNWPRTNTEEHGKKAETVSFDCPCHFRVIPVLKTTGHGRTRKNTERKLKQYLVILLVIPWPINE
jgi:hypothetical protein